MNNCSHAKIEYSVESLEKPKLRITMDVLKITCTICKKEFFPGNRKSEVELINAIRKANERIKNPSN